MNTFLPKKDPLKTYTTDTRSLKLIADIAAHLPKLLLTGQVQKTIKNLNVNALSVNSIIKDGDIREVKLAMAHLSFISHAYIWGGRILKKSFLKPLQNLG